jgi:hypothetical protein
MGNVRILLHKNCKLMDISTCNIKCVINVTPTKFIVKATFSAYTLIEDENQKESKGRGERDTNRGCFFLIILGVRVS